MSIEVLSVRGLRPEFGKVDRDLWLWFCEAKKDSENYHGPRVTKRLVQAKAKQAFQAAGILNFKASDGWYIRWLKRWNRSVNNAAMLNDENGSSGKRRETIGISKAKIVRKPKSKNASCSILKCQAQELISSNISKLAFGISNQSDGLGNSIISNTVTLSSSDLSANSSKDVSGSITPDDTFVSIGLNTTSQISIYSDFQERFSSKDCDLQNICHDVIPENNNFTPNSSFPLSVKELSWSDSSDTSYLEGQESSKVSQVQVIQKEHHVCINQTLPAASKQVSKQSLKGKGNLLDSQKCLTSSSFIHSVTQDTPKSTIESRLNWKGSSQNVCTGLQALHNLAVTNQASPKETGKSFSHTFTDFEVADCTSFAQQDLEDVSVSSDFVNHLNDEHSLDLSLEYAHGLLSQQISKKTLFSSKSIHNINLSCQSVQNGECDLSLSQPDCKRIVNGNSSKSGCHEIVSGENICNEENDYISEAVMLSMQEDDFSILDCDQSPFHGTISVVDENSQPDYEQVCNLDEGPQMTLGMKENANESMEIEFPSSCVSLYTTDGQEHVFIREIMKEKPSSGSSRQPPNNMIQEDNNCHILPHVECQEQSYISSILNEDCVESKRSQNSLLLNSHSLKTNLNSSFKSHIQVLSSLNENTDNQISSLDNGCYTSHEIYNLSPLLVEGENVCQGTSTESEIAFVEGQDFVRISASSFSNASITDQDVFLATYPDGGDLNSFPSTNLENTSLSVSHGALTSEDCSQEDSFEGILRTVPCESEKGANETSSTPIVTCDNSFLLMDSADYTENWEYLPGHTTENSREPSAVLTHHHHHDSLKENEITPCPTHLTDSVAYKQDKSFSSGGSSKLGKKSAPCLTERGKSNIVVEENHALYRRSSGDRYFPYFKERVANYAMKHTAKEAARYFGVNVDTVTMWTKGRQEQISTVNNQPDQVMLRWLKRNRESGIIHTRAQLFEKAAQLLKTPGNWVKDRSRWFYVWASRLVDDEERKRATSNTHEANLLPVDCGEKKALYPDEFKVEVVLYAEQTSKNLASTIFNIARKRVFEWTAAFKVSRDTWKGSHSIPEQSAATIDSDQSSTSSISGESLKVSTTLPSSFPSFGNGKPKLNGKGMGRAVTSVAVDRELWLWFCEQISKKSKPKSKDIRAKAVELFRAHNHNKIQCSHGWLKKWSVRYGIALRHEGDSDLLAWCLEQFDRNRNISHRDLLGHAHKSLTGTHKSEFKASAGWLVRFCKRHRSLLSTKPSIDIEIPTALRHHVFEFRLQTQKLIHSSKIPLSNVGCVDEVPLNFTAGGGSQSRLLLRRSGLENCHATVILCSLANGNILPPAIIFKGNGPTEHVSYDDMSLILFYQQDCCMTDAIMTQWLELVWNKNVASPSVLVADCYDPHCSKLVKEKCGKSDASLCIIPAGCAYKLQPLDLTVSRLFETCIYNKWTRHFAANDQISICKKNCYSSNSMIAQWVAEALKSLAQTQKEAVRRSFLVTGITSASNGTEDHLVEDPASIPRSSLFAPEV